MTAGAPPEVWIITGIPGAGKTSTARRLAEAFERSVLLSGDQIQELIVRGRVDPDNEPRDESRRQMALNVRHQCLLARSFNELGFTVVIDYVVVTRERLTVYQEALGDLPLHLVVLDPGQGVAGERDRLRAEKTVGPRHAYLHDLLHAELREVGFWIDNGQLALTQTVEQILEHRREASLRTR